MTTAELEEVEAPTEDGVTIEDLSVVEEVSDESEVVVEDNVEEASVEPDEAIESEDDSPDEEGVEITLGDESLTSEEEESADAPSWVRELRKEYRETKKQNRELQKRLAEREEVQPQQPTSLGPKPKLEDFDYDTDRFDNATAEYYSQKARVDAQKAEQEAQAQKQAEQWNEKLQSYEESKGKLGVSDFEDSEEVAMESFDQAQQALILQGTDNPALTIYAIGKNKARAQELASIKDPVKFVSAVAKLEAQLKVTKRKAKPSPEKTVKGSSPNRNGVDSTLERLEAEALKTNDYTKVFAYEKQLRAKRKQ